MPVPVPVPAGAKAELNRPTLLAEKLLTKNGPALTSDPQPQDHEPQLHQDPDRQPRNLTLSPRRTLTSAPT